MDSKLYKDRSKNGRRIKDGGRIVASVDLDPCEEVCVGGGGLKTCWCCGTPRKKQES